MLDLTCTAEKPRARLFMEPPAGYGTRFTDPRTDFGFKRILGNRSGTKIMTSFLNAVFQGEREIPDIAFSSQEIPGPVRGAKKVIFDLRCTGENGEQFIVEMQRANLGSFSDRMVFYNCRAINEQLSAGKESIDYAIKETYSIAVLDFILPGSPVDAYLHDACTYYRGSDELFSGKQRYSLIELPKFSKTLGELRSELDKWIYLLKHIRKMGEVPAVFRQGIFREVFEIAEISNFTMEDHKMYRSSLQDEHDYEMALAYAKQEAAKEGLEQGIEQGLKEGLEQGLEEGIEQGKQNVAKNLIRNTDFNDEEIAALAGVEESFVRRARSE